MTDETDEGTTMDDVDHTHPHTDAAFGESGVYDRGPEDASDEDGADAEKAARDGGHPDGDDRDDGDPVRTDGGADVPFPQPAWAVHDLSDDDR